MCAQNLLMGRDHEVSHFNMSLKLSCTLRDFTFPPKLDYLSSLQQSDIRPEMPDCTRYLVTTKEYGIKKAEKTGKERKETKTRMKKNKHALRAQAEA